MAAAFVIAVEGNPDSSYSFAEACHILPYFGKGHCRPSVHRSLLLPSCRQVLPSGTTDSSSFAIIRGLSCSYCLHNLPACYSDVLAIAEALS